MTKVRHVLGISGGKDSAALAIYMHQKYPELDIEYYTCDTGKELDETYQLIENLEIYLGKKIKRLRAAEESTEDPFDHFLEIYGNFIPFASARWCTKSLKLEPFENFIGDDLVVSYVGIRGDENREGYISQKTNIQSIFPFRLNIWSEDVIQKVLAENNLENLTQILQEINSQNNNLNLKPFTNVLLRKKNNNFSQDQKLAQLLGVDTKLFNQLVLNYLKQTNYPLAYDNHFPLATNDDNLVRSDIFQLLEDSGIGIPRYYEPVDFEINGQSVGQYARSRSGCYFCFYQQKIEWVWLYEQHPDLFKKAMKYEEKSTRSWNGDETLAEMIAPERIQSIKEEYLKRLRRKNYNKKSALLLDVLHDTEEEGCASCFI
ncbi:phosphoadenosine phosphosulfate reductase family protein [Siphonobacter aquaeclarae]|uniref:Phosphoadenosine phosphosulfate reductase family protein n=1 Tax=Siphonobacter aquaeclarae TaxID=563176 RepID=A0A1G9MX29_9BACT|nr:phosphoadenosine phosphosulfate reductase family protein [Siphonobacter aquaeclarae]SDL78581.1 Phosphoadenosine phosphosulfate reductase family protein [Siphonobacter aquaeclarae]